MLSISPNNSYNPKFSGLTRQLKRSPYADASEIIEKVEKYSKSKGIAGNLPRSWIEKLPVEGRSERIKDIYAEFGKAIATIKKSLNWTYCEEYDSGYVTSPTQDNIDKAKEIIASVLGKHDIVSSKEKVQMRNLSGGTYGSVQKLIVNYEEFNLKAFISYEKIVESLTKAFDGDKEKAQGHPILKFLSNCDGTYIEANRALYLNARQNPWFNKVFFTDSINGGMLAKFLGIRTKQPTAMWHPIECYGLITDAYEFNRNSINGVVFDFGGMICCDNNYKVLAENNTARRIYNQFRHTPKAKRESRFDSFSKQYAKHKESWVEELKSLLYKDFHLGNTPFKPREKSIQA